MGTTRDRTSTSSTVARALNDLGLAAWFGGSLMGAIGLNGAAESTDRPAEASIDWNRWSIVIGCAAGTYAVGGILVTKDNAARIASQAGVASTAALKAALTGTAMVATAYAAALGRQVASPDSDSTDAGEPSPRSSADVAAAQRRLKVVRWAVPALTAAAIVVDSRLSEQQRPREVTRGVLQRLNPAA